MIYAWNEVCTAMMGPKKLMDIVVHEIGEVIIMLFTRSSCLHDAQEKSYVGEESGSYYYKKSDCTLVAIKASWLDKLESYNCWYTR